MDLGVLGNQLSGNLLQGHITLDCRAYQQLHVVSDPGIGERLLGQDQVRQFELLVEVHHRLVPCLSAHQVGSHRFTLLSAQHAILLSTCHVQLTCFLNPSWLQGFIQLFQQHFSTLFTS